jgi:hypothetical protein
MVGLSDRMGDENVENILHTIRKDGVIVKPDVPLTPTDASFIAEATNDSLKDADAAAVVCATHSGEGSQTAAYVFAFTRDHKKAQNTGWTLDPKSVGVASPAVAYDFFNNSAQLLAAGHSLTGQLTKDHDWAYRVLVPVGPSGMALIGDSNLFVTRGRQRISSVEDDGKTIHTSVLLAPGESSVALTIFAPSQPTVTVKGGSVAAVTYDSNSKLGRVQLSCVPAQTPVPVEVTLNLP